MVYILIKYLQLASYLPGNISTFRLYNSLEGILEPVIAPSSLTTPEKKGRTQWWWATVITKEQEIVLFPIEIKTYFHEIKVDENLINNTPTGSLVQVFPKVQFEVFISFPLSFFYLLYPSLPPSLFPSSSIFSLFYLSFLTPCLCAVVIIYGRPISLSLKAF